MVIHLGCTSPCTSSDLPGDRADHTWQPKLPAPLFGLAPGGVCPATAVTNSAVRSYRTIPPLPSNPKIGGGIFSVALSVGSRLPGVTWHPVHRSPDFPPLFAKQRPSGRLPAWRVVPSPTLCKPNLASHPLPSVGNTHSIDGFLGHLRLKQNRPAPGLEI